ncbi:MAG TPA: hypothetical protein VFC44_23885 [Candidatus Saccharimonadales bacterium]|nr:hypothetical protein [Candidatus Saccharimonadales bacterium]
MSEIFQLRQLLAERFPGVPAWSEVAAAKIPGCWPTGLPALDALLGGGLPKSRITELVSAGPSAGSALLLRALLRQAWKVRQLAGLIDGLDSFDPSAVGQPALSRLLWVRCQTAQEALKAADILLRDRNLGLVMLDLKMNPAAQLRKISGAAWYRLQRLAQQTSTAFLVVTPWPMAPSAETRLILQSRLTLEDVLKKEDSLWPHFKFEQARASAGEESADAAG